MNYTQTTATTSQQPDRRTGRRCILWHGFTPRKIVLTDENGEQEYVCDKHPELTERIFNDIGGNDYIYQVIQESVDEATEEQFMSLQQNWCRLNERN